MSTPPPVAWVRRRRDDGAGKALPPAGDWWPGGAAQRSSLGASPSEFWLLTEEGIQSKGVSRLPQKKKKT